MVSLKFAQFQTALVWVKILLPLQHFLNDQYCKEKH